MLRLLPAASLLFALIAQAQPLGPTALALYAGALALFLATLHRTGGEWAAWDADATAPCFSRHGPYLLGLALLAGGGVLAIRHTLPTPWYPDPGGLVGTPPGPSYWHVFALWLFSLVAYVAAFGGWRWPPRARRLTPGQWGELAVVVGLLGLGLAARVVALHTFPPNFGGDEGSQALSARAVLDGTITDMFATGWFSTPTLFYFFQAVPLALVPDPVVGARLACALIGTAALGATYGLARALCGPWVALAALAVLAAFGFHVFFSRLASFHVTDSLAAAVVLWFTYRALAGGRTADYAAAGVFLGLAWYGYFGARVLALLVLVLVGREALARRGWLRWAWPRLAVLAGGAALTAAPLLFWYTRYPAILMERAIQVSVFGPGWIGPGLSAAGRGPLDLAVSQVQRTLLVFNYTRPIEIYYAPDHSLLLWPLGALLVLGLAYATYHWRQRAAFTLLAAFWGLMLAAALTETMPQTQRLIITAPVVAILVGLGLVASARALVAWSRVPARAVGVGAGLVLAACMAISLQAYFGGWAATPRYGDPNGHTATELADYLRELGPDGVGYLLVGRLWCQTYATVPFIAPGRCVDVPAGAERPAVLFGNGGPVALIAFPERIAELEALAAAFPTEPPARRHGVDGRPLFEARQVAPRAVQAVADSTRPALERATTAYAAATGAANRALALAHAGFTATAAEGAAAGLAGYGPPPPAADDRSAARLEEMEIAWVRVAAPQHARARVVARVTPAASGAAATERAPHPETWQLDYLLGWETGEWRVLGLTRPDRGERPAPVPRP
jgi:hypothetical protein